MPCISLLAICCNIPQQPPLPIFCVGRYGQTQIIEGTVTQAYYPYGFITLPDGTAGFQLRGDNLVGYHQHNDV